jgi:hypothetical protein
MLSLQHPTATHITTTTLHYPTDHTEVKTPQRTNHTNHSTQGWTIVTSRTNNTAKRSNSSINKHSSPIDIIHPLIPSPFILKRPSNMTSMIHPLSATNMTSTLTNKPSPTLLAIAKSISDKISPQPKRANQHHNVTSTRTMPIRTTTPPTSMLKLPKNLPPTPPNATSTPAANHCIPIMIRMQQPATHHGTFDNHESNVARVSKCGSKQ